MPPHIIDPSPGPPRPGMPGPPWPSSTPNRPKPSPPPGAQPFESAAEPPANVLGTNWKPRGSEVKALESEDPEGAPESKQATRARARTAAAREIVLFMKRSSVCGRGRCEPFDQPADVNPKDTPSGRHPYVAECDPRP